MNTPTTPITIRETQPDTVLQRMFDYLGSRGFAVQPQDQAELRAMVKGHANAADCATFETRENQRRIVRLDARDVAHDGYVNQAPHSLLGPVLVLVDNAGAASAVAQSLALEQHAPMLVCDGNDRVRDFFDEDVRLDVTYAVKVSFGEVQDAQAEKGHLIAGDEDLVDAGLHNLRGAYAVFTAALERFRKSGQHLGSVLFIENYEAIGVPIVHRTIV